MPKSCKKRQKQASNGFEKETYKLAELLYESEMTSHLLGCLSSDGIAGSNQRLNIARCRSLESFMGHIAAAEYPQERVLVQMNLKLRERLRYLCKCKDLSILRPCDERQCPNIKQRLEKHRQGCPGLRKPLMVLKRTVSVKQSEDHRNVNVHAHAPAKIFMYDKSMQTTETKIINDASTNWEFTELKQKMTSPKPSAIRVKRICNSASTMATIDYLKKTRSTMADVDVLRHTQSCNTTVSFKNFYKDRLQYEVLQWLREVPIVADFNSSTRLATEKTVNNLIDAIYKLSAKANCDTYESKLNNLIRKCIDTLPVSYHSMKCEKTKRILVESLITRIMVLNNRYIFTSSNSSSILPSFYPCGYSDFTTYSSMEELNEQPITKSYRKDIRDWVHAKKFKRMDGKAVNKTELAEKLLDRLFPLLYDKQTKNYKYLIRGGIIEILNKFSLAYSGSNNRLYLDDLATELANILLRTRAGYKPAMKSSNVSNSIKNFLCNSKNFLHRLRKRKIVTINDEIKGTPSSPYSPCTPCSPSSNSKTFFRYQENRRVTTVSNQMTRCYSYYTSRKISDMWFKLVKIDFHELYILYEITDNLLKLVIFNSLYVALDFSKNIITKILCNSYISEHKSQIRQVTRIIYTEELALELAYNYIFVCWIINKVLDEFKILFNYESIDKQLKPQLPGQDKQISMQKVEPEELQMKIVFNLLIKYGSLIIFNDAMTYNKNLLAKSKKVTSRKSIPSQYNTLAVF